MFDFFLNNMWASWLVLALLLAIIEMFTLDFTLLMLAAGAASGGVVASVFPDVWWLQVIVAIVVSIFTLFLLRPALLRKVHNVPGYRSHTDKMVGAFGVAMTEVNEDGGMIKVAGQEWSARTRNGLVVTAGADVVVDELDGAFAIVSLKIEQYDTYQ